MIDREEPLNRPFVRPLIALVLVIMLVTAFKVALDRSGPLVAVDEIQRIASPDRTVDAVILTSDAGATTSVFYRLCVVPHGGTAIHSQSVFAIDKAWHDQPIELEWKSDTLLQVTCKGGRVFCNDRFGQTGSKRIELEYHGI
ncbi:MAG: hypothetical protein HZC36_08610 [Armatimonadetes bacterium]|nr:hypothetical protein [Armatimonadota bacterium]